MENVLFEISIRTIGARGKSIVINRGVSHADALEIQGGLINLIEFFKHPKRVTTSVLGDHVQVMAIDDTKIYNNSELVCMIYIKEIQQ